MNDSKNIERSTWMHLLGSMGCCAFIAVYFYHILKESGFASWPPYSILAFSIFIFLFVCPVGVYLLYLALTKEPLLSIHTEYVELSSYILPQKKLRISTSEILNMDTNWVKGGGDQHSDLIFFLTDEAFERFSHLKFWRRKDKTMNALFWAFTNADVSPVEAVRLVKTQLKLPAEKPLAPYSVP